MIYSIAVNLEPFSVASICVDTMDSFTCSNEDDFVETFNDWLRPGEHKAIGLVNDLIWFSTKDVNIKKMDAHIFYIEYDRVVLSTIKDVYGVRIECPSMYYQAKYIAHLYQEILS